MKQNDFLRALKFVEPAMASNDVRYFLNGLLLDVGKETTLVATNGYVLAAIEIDMEVKKTGQYIIPCNAVKDIIRLFRKQNPKHPAEDISISIDKNALTIANSFISYNAFPTDGTYPAWRKSFPEVKKQQYKKDVRLQPKYLELAGKGAKELSVIGVRMRVTDPDNAIEIDISTDDDAEYRNARMLVMPMRL